MLDVFPWLKWGLCLKCVDAMIKNSGQCRLKYVDAMSEKLLAG